MYDADIISYVTQFAAGVALALVLELVFRRKYEPGYTWVTVVWGTAQVGLIVALRLRLAPLPALPPVDLTWWQWWYWVNCFVAAGLPIVVWQVIIQERRVRQLFAFMSRRHGQPTE